MSDNIPTTHQIVLDAIVAQLISALAEFDANTCILSINPEPPGDFTARSSRKRYMTVSPTEGAILDAEFSGGGENMCIENVGVIVTAFSESNLDRGGRSSEMLTHNPRGLLRLKHDIMKTLAPHDLKDGSGNRLLVENRMTPISTQRPMTDGQSIGDLAVTFLTPFEWDLS